MQNLTRLAGTAAVSKDVSALTTHLMTHDGLCTCGRWLAASDAKFILANIGPHDSPEPERRDVAVVAAYCYDCFSKINATLKRCKNAALLEKRSEAELRG